MRRLLGLFGFEGTDWMGAIPIYGGLLTANNARKAFENTLDLEAKKNLIDQRFKKSGNMLNNLNEWQSTTTSVVDEINQASAITAQQITLSVQDTKTNLQYNQAQDHLFNQLSEYTNQTTKALSDNINQVYTSLSQQQDATVIANNKTFTNIPGLISNLSSIVDNNFKYFNNFINQLSSTTTDLSSIMYRQMRRTQQRIYGQQSYFESLSKLDSTLMPLIIEGGLRPNKDANRLGTPQQRILFEQFDINYVSATSGS